MLPRRESPIFTATICAPGATPERSGEPGWCPAAMPDTWVPCDPASHTTLTIAPSSYVFSE